MSRALPIWNLPAASSLPEPSAELALELQTHGLRWRDPKGPGLSRLGGAGPSDHKAVSIGRHTIMVPIFTHAAGLSPFVAEVLPGGERATLFRHGDRVAELRFPRQPRFYARTTASGVPYWKIATLHGEDVLATTVLQTCTRYGQRETACQFCAIGQSLAAGATIAEKTPEQLAEVAAAAVELDGVKHVVLTTGTPRTPDRGARVLCSAARAIRERVDIPIQAQCEPPDDASWFERLRDAGVDSLGMHLEAVSEPVRKKIMPGKAEVPISVYLQAFERAVSVFGRGQVSTYVLAGLGDSVLEISEMSDRLIALGVYPFVVPFVPISGTPLERHPAPNREFMERVLANVAQSLARAGMSSGQIKAGCGRCGACSTLKLRELHA